MPEPSFFFLQIAPFLSYLFDCLSLLATYCLAGNVVAIAGIVGDGALLMQIVENMSAVEPAVVAG